jgi:hypothetical protein
MSDQRIQHTDGSFKYQTPEDLARQDRAACHLSLHLGHKVIRFPELCPVDWYMEKYDRLTMIGEFRGRNVAFDYYNEIYLSVEKWRWLDKIGRAFEVPALYVVDFTDQLRYIDIVHVNTTHIEYGGPDKNREDMYLIPRDKMSVACKWSL